MDTIKRPNSRPAILFFILASLVLAACGTQVASSNWPGLSADGDIVYVAYGPGVIAVDVAEQEQIWSFPEEGASATLLFYAAPSIGDELAIIGDYGASGGFFSPGVKVSVYALNDYQEQIPALTWTADAIAHDRIIAPPLQVGNRVYVGTADNFLYALDVQTGELLWQFETGHSIWAQPVHEDGVLYIASMDKSVYALDTDTGTGLWQQTFDGSIIGRPIIGDDILYVNSFDGALHALDLSTGEVRWSVPSSARIWSAPVLDNGVVYFADIGGGVYAVDAETGDPIWVEDIKGRVRATPIVHENILYIASAGVPVENQEDQRGELIALDVEDRVVNELWRKETPGPLFTSPVIVGDDVVVALNNEEALLLVFDRIEGVQRWLFAPPAQ